MRKLLILFLIGICCFSCKKDDFDTEHPDVTKFVSQLRKGTYNQYEMGVNGERLWLKMPKFTEVHIPALIELSKDTTHIAKFPVNPLSSRYPFPEGRDYSILGECLLWAVEGIINSSGYGSLDPYLINTTLPEAIRHKGISGAEILTVRELYKNWWNSYGDKDWKNHPPLEGTPYRWF
jgi:hypothetical protein